MHPLLRPLASRRFKARLLSTFLCSSLVVIRPFSRHGGPTAFLAITIKELVFSAQESLPQQIEATTLHLLGGFTGIALSSIGKTLTSIAYKHDHGTWKYAIPAITLTLVCFLAGWVKSRLPRLTLASRIACFVSVWILTFDVGERQHVGRNAVEFTWIVGVAAMTPIIACIIFCQWSYSHFAVELARALSELQDRLQANVKSIKPATVKNTSDHFAPSELLGGSFSLNSLYQQASFELRFGRVGVRSLKPLMANVEHLRRILSHRLPIPEVTSEDELEEVQTINLLQTSILGLGNVVLHAMKCIEMQIVAYYHASFALPVNVQKINTIALQAQITEAVNIARARLQHVCDDLDVQKRKSPGHVHLSKKVFDSCTCIISLLQMAQEVQSGLKTTEEIRIRYEESRLRLWHPRLSSAWLGVSPTMAISDEGGTFLDADTPEEPAVLSEREVLQGIAERAAFEIPTTNYLADFTMKQTRVMGTPFSVMWLKSLIISVWNRPKTLRIRLFLSKLINNLRTSPHFHHAFKNALGVALLGLPIFLPTEGAARFRSLMSFGPWMIISYVWVLETNTGATIRVGYLRLSGTILGATYAYVVSLFCKSDPYALVTMMTVAELPISWIIMKTNFSPMGTVAAVTIPPILFTPYFTGLQHAVTYQLALYRAASISAGIVAALLVNSTLFPRHCRALFLRRVCNVLGISNQLFMNMSGDLFHYNRISVSHRKRNNKLERETRHLLCRMAGLLRTMNHEVSLVPKPMQRYRRIHGVLQRLSNILVSLRQTEQHIPKKEVTAAVALQRRELVSAVCINIFASEQVFRAYQPLPQFLPSVRCAFISLEREVEEQILQSAQGDGESVGVSLIYVMAELELLAELVDTIDELVDLTRQLFGTSSWLSRPASAPMLTPRDTTVCSLAGG